MISKIRLSLFPWCWGLGHGQVSFPLERWKKQRLLSLPPSSCVAKLFSPVSPAGNLSFSERGRNRGWLLTCVHACMLSHVRLFGTPWTVGCQAPLSVEFSRQECWGGGGCQVLLQGIFLTQGANLRLLHRRQFLYPLSHLGSPATDLCAFKSHRSVAPSQMGTLAK